MAVSSGNVLRSLCKAGSYLVADPANDRSPDEIAALPKALNIERAPIEEHLAQCRAFILEWTNEGKGTPGHLISAQVSRIDFSIRQTWIDLYKASVPEGITFNRRIKRVECTTETMWSTDLTRDMRPAFNSDVPPGKLNKFNKFAKEQQKGVGKKAAKGGKTKGAGKVAGGKSSTQAVLLSTQATSSLHHPQCTGRTTRRTNMSAMW